MNGRSSTRSGPRRLLLCVAVMSVALPVVIPATATAREDYLGQVIREGPHVTVTEVDGVRFFEASESVSAQSGEGSPLAMSSTSSGSGYRVHFKNVLSSNAGAAQWVRHYYAQTRRLSGSGSYEAEAHAVLIEGDSYEDEQVFSVYTHSCAGVVKVNATAKTCASPRFSTSPGEKWFAISGQYYDHGNDGSVERVIAGELDYVWTAPSS